MTDKVTEKDITEAKEKEEKTLAKMKAVKEQAELEAKGLARLMGAARYKGDSKLFAQKMRSN